MICTSKKCVLDGFRNKNVWFQYIALWFSFKGWKQDVYHQIEFYNIL